MASNLRANKSSFFLRFHFWESKRALVQKGPRKDMLMSLVKTSEPDSVFGATGKRRTCEGTCKTTLISESHGPRQGEMAGVEAERYL